MANPARDYFHPLFDGPLKSFAEAHAVEVAMVHHAPSGHAVTVDGTVHTVGSVVSIQLKSAVSPLQAQPDRAWLVVYDYRLEPAVNAACLSFPGSQDSRAGARFPADLQSRDRPWPWTWDPHRPWAVGYQEVVVGDDGLTEIPLSWALYVAATATPLAAAQFQLRNFRLYSVRAYDLALRLTAPPVPAGLSDLPLAGFSIVPAALQRLSLPTSAEGSAAEYTAAMHLNSRDGAARFVFEGKVRLGSADGGWTSAVVFPAAAAGLPPAAGAAHIALIEYLALLDRYRRPTSALLSLEEAVFLDAEVFGIPAKPVPAVVALRDHRFLARPVATQPSLTAVLGGPTGVDMGRHFALAQALGQSGAVVSVSRRDFAEQIPLMAKFGLTEIHLTYYWQQQFILAAGTKIVTPQGWVLGKNPLQLDAQTALDAAAEFVAAYPDLDRLIAAGGRLVIQTPELGDTFGAFTFALGGSAADAARAALGIDGLSFELINAQQPALRHLGIAQDQQYQAGYRLDLIDRHSELVVRSADANTRMPDLPGLRAALSENVDVMTRLIHFDGNGAGPGRPSIDLADDAQLLATNGSYDQFPFSVGAFAVKPITQRRPDPMRPVEERAAWYGAMRYWNRANIAYVNLAVNALGRALGRIPFVHTTNMSQPIGYWRGYEHYHFVRSGALDVMWFHDQYSRSSGANQAHLLFVNVKADFARACARLRGPDFMYRPWPRGIGVYLASDRIDVKAIVWASRGATHFENYAACSNYLFPGDNGFYDVGDVSLQFMTQSGRAAQTLLAGQDALRGATRPPAVVAILVPMTDGVWDSADEVSGGAGFINGYVLDASAHGLHAIFTQRHLAVDFLFEEEIVDSPQRLDHYQVLVSTARLMRDDVFLSIARWVEARAGVLVCAAGSLYVEGTTITAGACVNEYHEPRQARLEWLDLPDSTPPDNHKVSARGLGFVVVPQESIAGRAGYDTRIGQQYIDGLQLTRGFFANASTTWGDARCADLFDVIDSCVEKARGAGRRLLTERHFWVIRNDGSNEPEPFVEAVLLLSPMPGPKRAAVVLIDQRERLLRPSPLDDERNTAIAEAQRVATDLRVIINNAILSVASATLTDGLIALPTTFNSFDIALQDYAVIELIGA